MPTAVVSDFDDLLGTDNASPLDEPICVTVFDDTRAVRQTVQSVALRNLASSIQQTRAGTKNALPLLKLASFGNLATDVGCLRSTDNIVTVTGVEADYDGEEVGVDDARRRLEAAGIAAAIYTSPSHKPHAPRWRILAPLSVSASASDREALCARLNGALGGILAPESFTASQAYYFGQVDGGAAVQVEMVDGAYLDQRADLDQQALGRDGRPYRPAPTMAAFRPANDDYTDWARIDSALRMINVVDADTQEAGGRDLYLRVGQALHHASNGGDAGRERWEAWARGGEKFNAKDFERDWQSFGRRTRGRLVTIGSLYDTAERFYGWADPGLTISPDDFDPLPPLEEASPSKAAELRFLAPSDCADSPRRGYIVKGMLAPGDLGCIFGAPGAGKSLIAPHLGYALAQGRSTFGMRTKAGPVFYVAAEDPHGMRGRVTALRTRHGDAPDFLLVEGVSDLFTVGSDDLASLRAAVAERRPSLIVIDTLAMGFPGLEENAAEDMNRVVAIGRKLTREGAAVVLVHHDTKAQGPTPRGHSALNGALDMAMQLFPRDDGGVVRGKLTKNRNGSCDRDIAFRIDTELLGHDEDGDAITVAVLDELAPGSAPRPERLPAAAMAALKMLRAIAINGVSDEAAWRSACVDGRTVSSSESLDARQAAFRRAFERLTRTGSVFYKDGTVRLPEGDGSCIINAFDADAE